MQKGGVGKTTTSMNLSGALADRGEDVLLVDVDPQGGSTLKLGYRDEYRAAEYALYDVLADYGELNLDQLDDLIIEDSEFDLVPAHIRNFRLEKELYGEARGVEALRLALDRTNVDESYDYVIIDSPPNLGPLSDGSLIASEQILFPTHPNEIAPASLEILFDEIDTLNEKFDQYDISRVGAVLNEVPPNGSVAERQREFFYNTFGEEIVFEVDDLDVIEHAIGYNTSIYGYDPEDAGYPWDEDKQARVCESYDQIADHIESYR